jgi:hypothetical protein
MKRKKTVSFTHFIKVNPSYSVSYFRSNDWTPPNRAGFSKQLRKNNATLSDKAKTNLRNCFNWLRIISNQKEVYSKQENKTFKFKLNFITLTLPSVQVHSDEYIKSRLLEPFLKWMGRSWNANSYIWKAEVQNCGNIHFHITTNKFIHWKSVRTKWNRLLAAHGYCKVYQDGTNDKGDSATKIHAVKNEKEITSYIVGYVSKKDTFKSIKKNGVGKKQYIYSESCEINNHYYLKELYRQVECIGKEVREYKREVHGRIWSASYNLNQSSMVINSTQGSYDSLNDVLLNNNICKVVEWFDKKTENGIERVYFDWYKIHIHKKKILKYFPISIREQFKAQISKMVVDDVKQTRVEIDSIF